MNKKVELKEAMKDSISEILEKMFFMPIDFPDEQNLTGFLESQEGPVLSARLAFRGPFTGDFSVFAPRALVKQLVANLLGLEEKDFDEEQIEATLKELLNMVAGKTFGLYDRQSVFDLSVPEIVRVAEAASSAQHDLDNEITLITRTVNNLLGFRVVIG